jgi:hypothetical protein
MKFCGMCGRPVGMPFVTPDEARIRHCVSCGRAVAWDVNVCQYCGHDFRAPKKEVPKDQLVAGGVLTILAGILSIVLITIIVSSENELTTQATAMALLLYVFGGLGIFGGLLALMKRAFPVAVLGAACSIFGLGFFFGIPGLAMIIKSSTAFVRKEEPQK